MHGSWSCGIVVLGVDVSPVGQGGKFSKFPKLAEGEVRPIAWAVACTPIPVPTSITTRQTRLNP